MSSRSPAVSALTLVELTQVLHAFFHALDERRYDRMLEHFTADCRWLRQGQWLEGHSAVRAALAARPVDAETRHVITNTYVSALEGTSAEVASYMTAYRYPAATVAGPNPPSIAGPLRFNLTTTVFRLEPDRGWRIAEQRMVAAFGFTG